MCVCYVCFIYYKYYQTLSEEIKVPSLISSEIMTFSFYGPRICHFLSIQRLAYERGRGGESWTWSIPLLKNLRMAFSFHWGFYLYMGEEIEMIAGAKFILVRHQSWKRWVIWLAHMGNNYKYKGLLISPPILLCIFLSVRLTFLADTTS